MVIYSHSRLTTFEQCPLKYKFRYLDKLQPDYENSIEAFLGQKIHSTLEWIYSHAKERSFELDEVIKYYINSWMQDFTSQIKVINEEYTTQHYFNKGIRFLIDYFLKHSPFKDNTIETEKKILFTLDVQKEYKIIGYIDRLVHNKVNNTFEIHDYKTGATKSQKELDRDRQLAIYSLALQEYFKEVNEVFLVWHFLDTNQEKRSKRTPEELKKLRNEIIQLINKIESTKEFNPQPSALCKWCEFRSYCPTINNNINSEVQIR